MRFHGKTALVTGAASGIGRAVADRLVADGAERLVLVDSNAEALAAMTAPCTLDLLPGDVADETFWHDSGSYLDGLDLAVVNAGTAAGGTIAELSLHAWRAVMAVNLDGAFLTLRASLRAMRDGGAIVAVASASGLKAQPGVAAYGASKAALLHLVKVAALEAAPRGIRVNAIAPGGVETPVWDAVPMFADRAREIGRDAAFAELAATGTPLGRYARPEEVAAQIAWLLSAEAALITGATLLADGGYTL